MKYILPFLIIIGILVPRLYSEIYEEQTGLQIPYNLGIGETGDTRRFYGQSITFTETNSGNYMITGDRNGGDGDGAIYILFQESDGTFTHSQYFYEEAPDYFYGVRNESSGNIIAIGSESDNAKAGTVYVYAEDSGTWTSSQNLIASDNAINNSFGKGLALEGNVMLIGADGNNASTGAAYVFVDHGSGYIETQKLVASDGSSGDSFGDSLAMSGNLAIITAPGSNSNLGAAYIFAEHNGTWSEITKLSASDGVSGDRFGLPDESNQVCAISGNLAIVNAFNDDSGTGSAYVFYEHNHVWSQNQKLVASDGLVSDEFGTTVELSGNLAIFGVHSANINNTIGAGSAYLFAEHNGVWTEVQKFTDMSPSINANFGMDAEFANGGNTLFISYFQFNGINVYTKIPNATTTETPTPEVFTSGVGNEHALFITSGNLYSIGQNTFGQLGNTATISSNAIRIGTKSDWISVDAGATHSIGLDSSGNVYTWGNNDFGQLGTGNLSSYKTNTPTLVSALSHITKIEAGAYFNYAEADNGSLYSWGKNNHGQLGAGNTLNQNVPLLLSGLPFSELSDFAAGIEHILFLASGNLYACGSNGYGQLGTGSSSYETTPVLISGNGDWRLITAGGFHSLAVDNYENLYGWGKNAEYQLGLSDPSYPSMTALNGFSGNIDMLTSGFSHSLILMETGDLYGLGSNEEGQIGAGQLENSNSPYFISGNWSLINSDHYSSYGIDNDQWKRFGKTAEGNIATPSNFEFE